MSEPINSAWPFGEMEDGGDLDVSAIFGDGASGSDVNPFDPLVVPAEESAASPVQPQAAESEPAAAPEPQPKSTEPSVSQAKTKIEPAPKTQKSTTQTEEPSNVILAALVAKILSVALNHLLIPEERILPFP